MKIEELQAQVAALTAENEALKTQTASFSEQETSLKAREAAVAAAEALAARAAVEVRVDAAIKGGRLLPAQRKHTIDFAVALASGEAVIDFGEGDKAEKLTQREAYLRQIESQPVAIEYGERAPADGATPPSESNDPQATADKARDLIKKAHTEGKTLSFTEAVSQVMTAAAE